MIDNDKSCGSYRNKFRSKIKSATESNNKKIL